MYLPLSSHVNGQRVGCLQADTTTEGVIGGGVGGGVPTGAHPTYVRTYVLSHTHLCNAFMVIIHEGRNCLE